MSYSCGAVAEAARPEASELDPSCVGVRSPRALLRRCVWEVVLPIVVLVSMSVFTVTTIVWVVATLAKAGVHL